MSFEQNSSLPLTGDHRGFIDSIPLHLRSALHFTLTTQENKVPTATSALTGGAVVDQIDQGHLNERKRQQISVDVPLSVTGYKYTTEFGGGVLTVVDTIDASAQTLTPTYLTVEGEVQNIGPLTIKKTAVLPSGPWPVERYSHIDEKTGIATDFTSQVVSLPAATTSPWPLVSGVLTDSILGAGTYVEYQKIDGLRTRRIAAKVNADSLPSPIVYAKAVPMKFILPPKLLSSSTPTITATTNVMSSSAASGDVLELPVEVTATAHDEGRAYSVQDAHIHEAIAAVTRTFYTAPPTTSDLPVLATFFTTGGVSTSSYSVSTDWQHPIARIFHFSDPEVTTLSWAAGSVVTIGCEVTDLGFGLWMSEVYRVTVHSATLGT